MQVFSKSRWATVFTASAALLAGLASAHAQSTAPAFGQGPGTQGRDCQTIRTCNFARNAEVRGCLSSYTCRTCRFVTASCRIGSTQGPCQKLSCTWGG